MKKRVSKVFAVLLSVMIIFSMFPFDGYAETSAPEKVVAKLNNRGFKQAVDLGPAASTVVLTNAVYGKENGRDIAYTTANGGKFNVVDIKDNQLLFSAQLGDVVQVWSHSIAPDGTVYIAAQATGSVGELWSYTPPTKTVRKLGKVEASGQSAWSSTVDADGNVYIGTYGGNTTGSTIIPGKIIKYSPSTGEFQDLGMVDKDYGYVRSLAYYDGYIYAGLGQKPRIYKINVQNTDERTDITGGAATEFIESLVGKSLNDMKFCYDLAVVDNKYLFAKIDDGGEYALLFYDLEKQEWLNKKLAKPHDGSGDDFGVFNFTQIPTYNNKAYVSYKKQIQEIDLIALGESAASGDIAVTTPGAITITRATGIKYGAGWRGAAFVNLGTAEAPEMALSTLKGEGVVFLVRDIETATDSDKITLPCVMQAAPITLHSFGKGPDGKLYMTTYPGGPKGAQYDPKTGTFASYAQGQAEGMIAGNGSDLYFGIYPGAIIQKMNTNTLQIEPIFNLKDTYEQDRPYIMQFADNKLLIGTIPDYGKLGGTLTIYDTLSGDKKIYRNVVQDQSIVGLAYKDGKIYGSTTIFGGLGSTPAATAKAEIFVWDIATEEVIREIDLTSLLTDLDKPPMISGLNFGKDNLLWGAVDGYIFAMNPETYEIVKSKNIYPNIKNRGMWRPVHILWGEDGLLYTDVGGKLTVMDPSNLNHVTLIGSGPEVDWIALAKDSEGNENIYFLDNGTTNPKMIPVIEGGEVEQPPAETVIVNVPINNAGFEKPANEDGSIPGWSSLFKDITPNVSFGISEEKSKTGKNSLKIVDNSTTTETVYVQSDLIPAQGGIEYTASVELFHEKSGSTFTNRSSFMLRFFDESGTKQVGADAIIHVAAGHENWQTVKVTAKAPANAKYARLFCGTSALYATTGSYYDDFKLTYVGLAADKIKNVPVINPDFEMPEINGVISGWSSTRDITDGLSVELTDRPGTESGKCIKVVDLKNSATPEDDNQIFIQSDFIPVQEGIEYTASVDLYLEAKGSVGQSRSVLILRFYDESFKQIGLDKDARATVESGQESWQTVTLVKKAPDNAKYVRLLGGVTPVWMTPGAYYDNFKLSYIGDVPESLAPGTLLLSAPEKVGEGVEFDVAVKYFGSEAKNLYAFESLINYDSTKVEFISAQKAGSYQTEKAVMNYHGDTPGTVRIVSTLTGDAVCENGDVVILKFKALTTTGKTNITLVKNSKMISADSDIEYSLGMDKFVTIDNIGKVYEPEDVNNDGAITLLDVVTVAKNVGAGIDDSNRKMDINHDGKIDISDVGLVMVRYMELD